MKKNNFFKALATLIGTIIGVGLFSLPYITSKVGIWTMLSYFLILGTVTILINFIYGEIVLRTKKSYRLPGYAGKYLGKWAKRIVFLSNGLGLSGALLAYLVIGGSFLFSLFGPVFGGNYYFYVLVTFSIGALLIFFGIKSIARAESFLLIFFFFVLIFIFKKSFPVIEINNLFNFNLSDIFLPYGAILFSISGATLIPEVKEMLGKNSKSLRKVIFFSVLISILVYLFFILIVTGITGQDTSQDAISGLKNVLSNGVVALALVFGFLTVFTSFLTIGLTLKKILWYDMGIKKNLSWALACFVPLILFFLGLNNFITIISLVGGVFIGVDVTMMILTYLKAKKHGDLEPVYSLNLPRFLVYSLILFFILGAAYEIYYFIG
ncbi:MAG: aromatic amino acid transport family protein [Candidatus Portnoybacteria bacterium]